jgi:hypothetical protein
MVRYTLEERGNTEDVLERRQALRIGLSPCQRWYYKCSSDAVVRDRRQAQVIRELSASVANAGQYSKNSAVARKQDHPKGASLDPFGLFQKGFRHVGNRISDHAHVYESLEVLIIRQGIDGIAPVPIGCNGWLGKCSIDFAAQPFPNERDSAEGH